MTPGGAPRFSVVIPTHRRPELVVRTVGALAGQTERDFEVIVVVDGLGDAAAPALRALEPGFPLTVIEQENAGRAAACNAGAAAARGELLLFLDDDMRADPALLAEHARSHGAGADVVIGHLPLDPSSPPGLLSWGVGWWSQRRLERLSESSGDLPLEELITGQMSIRREVFADLGGYDASFTREGLYGGEDLDFSHRALEAGLRLRFNPAAVSWQHFDVDPAVYLRRAYETGRSDAELQAKHPDLPVRAEKTFDTRTARLLVAPFVALPEVLGRPVRWLAAALARTGRTGARVRRTFFAVRTLEHRRGVRDARRRLSTGRAVVLAYHAVEDLTHDRIYAPYGVTAERFGAQLDALARAGRQFIDLDTLLAALDGRARLPRGAVLVTFDDAYVSVLEAGLPELRRRGIPAVVFAVAGQIGGTNAWDAESGAVQLPLLDAGGLLELHAGGVEIGSHALTHRMLPTLDDAEIARELAESADRLEAVGLPRPRAVAYPHGEADERVEAAARAAGYAAGFTVEPGVVERGAPRLLLPRVEVLASNGPFELAVKTLLAAHPGVLAPVRRARRALP